MRHFFLYVSLLSFFHLSAQNGITVSSDTLSPVSRILKYFPGNGIVVKNIKYKGDPQSFGIYTDSLKTTGFESGIVITTGLSEQIVGPNGRPNAGANFGNNFFKDEDVPVKSGLCDGTVISFDFISAFDSFSFQYAFASEEYPEFVNKDFNDLFLILLKPLFIEHSKAMNLAVLPDGNIVSVNNLNSERNADLFIANDNHNAEYYTRLEFDGLSRTLVAGHRIVPGKLYRIKIILADAGDCEYDSGIFLKMNSFSSESRRKKPAKLKVKLKSPDSLVDSVSRFRVSFDYNSDYLNPSAMESLINLVDSTYKLSIDTILITGFTDTYGIEKHNHRLALKRAKAVAAFIREYGNKNFKLIVTEKESARPLSNKTDKNSRALNRRVEIQLSNK